SVILSDPSLFVSQPNFSADGRWIIFNASNQPDRYNIYLVPFRGATAIDRRDWTPLTAGEGANYLARWSPDGTRFYFFSNRDGLTSIWMQPVNTATKLPVGTPEAVYRLHDSRYTIPPFPAFGFSIARDKAVFPLRELTGNIWMASATGQK